MSEYEDKMLKLRRAHSVHLESADRRDSIPPVSITQQVIEKHAHVPFVDRIRNAKNYPSRPNYDESGKLISRSTHLMSRGGGGPGERAFVYPTLQYINNEWKESKNPTDAIKRGNVVYFDNVKEADRFAKGSWKPYAEKTRDDK